MMLLYHLQLCANLDTWRIMSPENCRPQLLEHNPKPCKQYDLCQRRREVREESLGRLGSGAELGKLGLGSDSTSPRSCHFRPLACTLCAATYPLCVLCFEAHAVRVHSLLLRLAHGTAKT